VKRRQRPIYPSTLKAVLGGIFLIAFGTRLFLVMVSDRTVWGDEPSYLWLADNFLSGKGFTHYQGIPDIMFPPGYPLLVGLARQWTGSLVLASDFWFIAAGTFALIPLLLLGEAIFGWRIALLAGLLYSLSPAMLAGTLFAGTLTEPPYLFFLFSGLYFGYQTLGRDRFLDYFMTGLCFAAAYLIRPEGYLYFLLFFAYRVFRFLYRAEAGGRALGRLALLAVGFLLLALPYVLYLHSVLGSWTLSGKSTQAYVTAKALVQEDYVKFDLESWGLDWRKKEVRYYSSEVVEIPLLTLFFENPVGFFRDIAINARQSLQHLMATHFFGPYLVLLATLGLFAAPWDRRRAKGEFYLILALLPLAGFWMFHVIERYLYPAVPILLLWASAGMSHLSWWVDRTVGGLWRMRMNRNLEAGIKGLALFALVIFFVGVNYRIWLNPYAPHIYELKSVARWIHENTIASSVIMCRQPEIAYHADRDWVVFPHAPYPECVTYARNHDVDYWIFEGDVIRSRRAHLLPVIEGRWEVPELKEVYRMELPPDKVYVIYRMKEASAES